MKLSERAQHSAPSMTMALIALANEKHARGEHVVSMVAGEPDFPTPDNIRMAGIQAIANNNTKYGSATGTIFLRRAIAKKLRDDNHLDFLPEQIVVATGTKPLLFSAFMAVCDPDSEVIIPAPYWVSYPSIVELAGAKPVVLPCTQADRFKLTPEALRSAITPKTRAILLNTPNNPSGAVYSEQEQRALLDVLREFQHVYLVTDEIYEHLIYDGRQHHSPAALAPDLADRIIVINGFSKGYGMIGWRLGFAAGPSLVMKAMASFLSHILGAPSTITQAAALVALEEPRPYLKSNREAYEERRNVVVGLLNNIDGISFEAPEGAFFVLAKCSAFFGKVTPKGTIINDDADFATALVEETGVAIVPGSAFGLTGYFRLSYSLPVDALRLGISQLADFCGALRWIGAVTP
jgi:aspartate aminotransferase